MCDGAAYSDSVQSAESLVVLFLARLPNINIIIRESQAIGEHLGLAVHETAAPGRRWAPLGRGRAGGEQLTRLFKGH